MDHHARVLEQRVQVAPVGRRGEDPQKRVGGKQCEEEKPGAHDSHYAEHPRHHIVGEVAAEERHADRPYAEYQRPQQYRAFVPAPYASDAVGDRERGIGVGSDIGDGEVIRDETVGEAAKGDGHEDELPLRGGSHRDHPRPIAAGRPCEPERRLGERKAQREGESELTDFRDHLRPAPPCTRVRAAFSLMD